MHYVVHSDQKMCIIYKGDAYTLLIEFERRLFKRSSVLKILRRSSVDVACCIQLNPINK